MLHLTHLDVQSMINTDMLRCEKNTLRRLSDGKMQHKVEMFLRITGKGAKKGIFSPIYDSIEEGFK